MKSLIVSSLVGGAIVFASCADDRDAIYYRGEKYERVEQCEPVKKKFSPFSVGRPGYGCHVAVQQHVFTWDYANDKAVLFMTCDGEVQAAQVARMLNSWQDQPKSKE